MVIQNNRFESVSLENEMLPQIQPLLVYGLVLSFILYNGKHVKSTKGEFVGAIRNLTVKVLPNREYAERKDVYKFLKLNISWLPPNSTRQPSSYSIIVTGIPKKGKTTSSSKECPEGSLFYILEGNKRLDASLPEYNNLTDIPDLYIRPSCSYKVQVLANPRMKYTANASEVIYTVPECIGLACSCINDKSKLPVPKVNVTRTENQIVVDWSTSFDASNVQFYVISIGVPLFKSKRNKVPLYNVIKIGQVSADERTFLWNLRSSDRKYIEAEDDYKMMVKAVDYRGCLGPEGSFDLRSVLSSVKNEDQRRIWLLLIGVTTSFILFGVLSILLYRNYNKFSVVNQGDPIGSIRRISECKSQWTEAILRKRNILYTRNESEEEGYVEETDKLKVPLGSVRLIRELGSGQFGKVYLGHLNDTKGSLVAVKMSRQGDTSIGSDGSQEFLKEIEMMRTAGNHPHLVNLVGYCVQPSKPICILLEYMQGGDLLSYLHRRRKQHRDETVFDHDQQSSMGKSVRYANVSSGCRLSTREDYWIGRMKGYQFLKFATEIAMGMEHLETKGITHRDLAARNILLGADLTVKISDFGLSRNGVYVISVEARTRKAQHLPIRWMSPEALQNRIFSSKSDVWSFGVVLWEMGTLGGFPYSNVTDDRLLRYIIHENGRLEQPSDVPSNIYKLMDSCWATEPESRPNFMEILSDLRTLSSFNDRVGTISNPCYAFS